MCYRLPRRRCRLLGASGLSIREARAAAAVPISLDAIAACGVTMHRRHITEKTAIGAVFEQMASHFDTVARLQVLALDAHALESPVTCGFHGPGCRLAFLVLDLDVEPGMRNEIVHFSDTTFHRRPFCDVVEIG